MTDSVLFKTLVGLHGNIGLIILNRPKQLNVLTYGMTLAIYSKLMSWRFCKDIQAVVIIGSGDKAFCAGGDLRFIYELRHKPDILKEFFWHEYRLNQAIHHFPKPYIAFLNGITMGGGAGISLNGSHRIATKNLKLAMPETKIGFITDVGASYFLNRCPGKVGYYLGLTGNTVNADEAKYAGLIDYIIQTQDLSLILSSLLKTNWSTDNPFTLVTDILQPLALSKCTSNSMVLPAYELIIDTCFSKSSLVEILIALQNQSDEWAHKIADLLLQRSPLSLKVVLAQLNYAENLDFDSCMQMEYRLACKISQEPDFFEGIRALIIDKDDTPQWKPNHLKFIPDQKIKDFFLPFDEGEELYFETPDFNN